MSAKKSALNDFLMLAEIRPHLVAPHAAVLLAPNLEEVLWSNAEGASLIGSAGKIKLAGSPATASTMRQIGLAVEKLDGSDTASAAMRIKSGFQTKLLAFTVKKINLPRKRSGILLVTDKLHGRRYDPADTAEATIASLDGVAHSSVIFDQTGKPLASAKNYDGLKLTESLLRYLAVDLDDADGGTIARAIKSKTMVFEGGASRLSDDPILNLLTLDTPKKLSPPQKKKAPAKSTKTTTKETSAKKETSEKKAKAKPTTEESVTANEAPRVGAFSSKRVKPGESGPGKWYYKQTGIDEQTSDTSSKPENKPKKTTPKPSPAKKSVKEAAPAKVDTKKKAAAKKVEGKSVSRAEPKAEAPDANQAKKPTSRPKAATKTKAPAKPIEPPKQEEKSVSHSSKRTVVRNVQTSRAKPVKDEDTEKPTKQPAPQRSALVQDVDHTPLPSEPNQTTLNPSNNDAGTGTTIGNDFSFSETSRPVRFVWATNADQRFTSVSGELAQTLGTSVSDLEGKTWQEASAEYGINGDEEISQLLSSGKTWSGKTVLWPIEGSDLHVPVDLAGLPTHDRNKEFSGFNGFGIIRTADAMVRTNPVTDEETIPQKDEPETAKVVPSIPRDKVLSNDEKNAFNKIGQKLSDKQPQADKDDAKPITPSAFVARKVRIPEHNVDTSILSRLPIPVLVYRAQDLLFANAYFFETTGYSDLHDLASAGGVDALFGAHVNEISRRDARIFSKSGDTLSVIPNIQRVPWDENRAMLLTLRKRDPDRDRPDDRANGDGESTSLKDAPSSLDQSGETQPKPGNLSVVVPSNPQASDKNEKTNGAIDAGRLKTPIGIVNNVTPLRPLKRAQDSAFGQLASSDLRNILDTASDGVVVLDEFGNVQALNRSAEALFDVNAEDVSGNPFSQMLVEESRPVLSDYLESVGSNGVASILNDGREVIGVAKNGGLIPLFMTMGKLADGKGRCAVLRDITQWKSVEAELVAARKDAEEASKQKSEFLAKVSHEIRTPLNAIIGFSDLMISERLGPIDNERYRGYVRDIKTSGNHVLDLVNDLLDITKIEAGQMDMDFESCDINRVVSETVSLTQPQANEKRVIIRTSLSAAVPSIVADERSLKQIILNLVSNSIKFTKAGGQVIVSTVYQQSGEVILRIRDTGVGMSNGDLEKAMQPFTQLSAKPYVRGEGTGLGLPLTKAMVEANRAAFHIESEPESGTLAEIVFPNQRVLAER